ncbi:glycosyltransferase [Aliiglaciecola sp. 3_MG-2023]|uniref:glycosyltransferase n=1 Tax=Aliiglaciecola sp. 3_MG-2023 TaxID=3062644 RepID=UPI0026E3284A|nr:glycosyltransferase [Aliiglaciecola sp. 3_MG-2023]MDO6691918.1 glycosyltransferase [Aliiglaciecola sp. 3_MG-2023]
MNLIQDVMPWSKKHLSQFQRKDLLVLFEVDPSVEQDQSIPITHLMVLIYSKTHQNVNLNDYRQRYALVEWYLSIGEKSFAIDHLVTLLDTDNTFLNRDELTKEKTGVNIVGYARSLTGLGEDVRTIIHTIENLGIPFCTISLRHISDSAIYSCVVNETYFPRYSTSIFCMNIIEYQKFVANFDNMDAFGHIILQAPWELPRLPVEFIHAVQTVNEFWAISTFVESALIEANLTNVSHVYPAIETVKVQPNVTHLVQKKPFTFLYIFDAGSYLTRKNPLGLITAFQRAFYNNEEVLLLLKVSNAKNNDEYSTLKSACSADNRIKLIEQQLNKPELTSLYSKADCYVSLHRSEGFGRTIAEAAMHNLPIIATSWSGSNDIIPPNSELLVSFELKPLAEMDYPFSKDQIWAEPNLNHASELMAQVYEMSESDRLSMGEENCKYVLSRFSPERAQQQISSLLEPRFSPQKVNEN